MTAHRTKLLVALLFLAILIGIPYLHSRAQTNDLVASLEKVSGVVEVKRVDTANWVSIARESLIGVGDSVRTGVGSQARITFFANGTDTQVLANSEFRIDAFNGSESQYQLSVTIVVGQTVQRVSKLLDSNSSYAINSNGLELAVRGTELAVRVEPSGRSAMLVQTGAVRTKNNGATDQSDQVQVGPGYGIRAEHGKGLSDVVPATSFAALDAALDGCKTTLQFQDDIALNVRLGPDRHAPRIGRLDTNSEIIVIGTTQTSKWYRTPFKGGFAWFTYPGVTLAPDCTLLRKFPDNIGVEDATKFHNLDPDITLSPAATAEPTAAATKTP